MLKTIVEKKVKSQLNTVKLIKLEVFDAFITFDPSIEDKVNKLYSVLNESVEASFYLDKPSIVMNMVTEYGRLMRNMLRCKLMICCINKDYLNSRRCRDVLTIAYTNSKPLVLLLFQELSLKDMPTILFAIDGAARVPVYKYLKGKHASWNGPLIPEISVPMQVILNRKIEMKKQLAEKDEILSLAQEALMGSHDSGIGNEFFEDEDEDENKKDSQQSAIEAEMKKMAQADANTVSLDKVQAIEATTSEGDDVYIKPARINLRLAKNSQLFKYASGYNRMVYLESRKRFLITSSYNKTITSVDRSGNWLDKRNPGGLLKLPFAICVNAKSEIFVGDNELKCIFIFDQNFKHLRTFAQNLLNGYTDMVIDDKKNELYACNLYDSVVASIDIKQNVIKNKVQISVPTFIRLFETQIVLITADDTLYVLQKSTHELVFKIEIENAKYLNGLATYNNNSIFFTSCEESETESEKPRSVCLSVVKLCSETEVRVKKLNLDLSQANDMILMDNLIACVDDTHINLFEYSHVERLLDWEEPVKKGLDDISVASTSSICSTTSSICSTTSTVC